MHLSLPPRFGCFCPAQIDHRHLDVRNDFLAWGPWVLNVCPFGLGHTRMILHASRDQTLGSNGFRLDAIKHMDRKFLLEFVSTLFTVMFCGNLTTHT